MSISETIATRYGKLRVEKKVQDKELQNIAAEIIQRETSGNSWSLMHRYTLCHDFLDKIGNGRKGLALLFVWLRFSALRQLDSQRNYNTQPRGLSHAQQRLTSRLSQLYTEWPGQRGLIGLMLTTMRHGGEGQRIRDEILEIMHRHRIKEVPGFFLEQWHQKMHNNSTPDDIVICDAYRAFLHGDGDVDAFYQTLESRGVTRHRLESFERPITATPDFYPDKKDAMIRDFEHFLETLKSVHSATDLKTRIQAARHCFDANMHQLADFIQTHRDVTSGEMISLVEKVTEMRHLTTTHLEPGGSLPELLCLDIAMEDFVRTLVERSIQSETDDGMIIELLTLLMSNFLMANEACLERLNSYRKAVITNTPESCARRILQTGGIEGYFEAIVTSDKVKHGKPDPAIIYEACRILVVDPAMTLLVGDH